MNVSLPEELKAYVEAQTRHGYSTPSEYVRELIRADRKQRERERVDALLLEGLNSGDSIPVNAQYWKKLSQEPLKRVKSAPKRNRK
jgi:antitoxin ParD1/3/4